MPEHTDREQKIRERAYSLWVEAGSPEGRQDEFWHRARELEVDGRQDASPKEAAENEKRGS